MYHFIINLKSGKGAGKRIADKISSYLDKKNYKYEIHETTRKGHAKELAAQCSIEGDVVVAVGGDGTFHEVLNGLDTQKCSLGFIPCGRGNDFANAFGLSKNPIKAIETVLYGEIMNIDYIQVGDDLRCLNVCGTGLDVAVLEGVENKRDDKLTYLMSLIHCLNRFVPYELDVEADGKTAHYSCIMAGACNGKQFGGGIKISPLSDFASGKINVVIMEMPANKRIMKALMGFVKGKHLGQPYTHHFECDSVKVTSPNNYPIELDGEIYRGKTLDCKIVPAGLKTFRP